MKKQTAHKAVASILTGLATLFAEFGIDPEWLTDGFITAAGTLLATILVYQIPNKEKK